MKGLWLASAAVGGIVLSLAIYAGANDSRAQFLSEAEVVQGRVTRVVRGEMGGSMWVEHVWLDQSYETEHPSSSADPGDPIDVYLHPDDPADAHVDRAEDFMPQGVSDLYPVPAFVGGIVLAGCAINLYQNRAGARR